jgi:hypothetical protein
MNDVQTPGGSASYDFHITESKFWNVLLDDVYGARSGGAIIFVDAENARKGVAKTSCAVAMARLLAVAFDYKIKKEDLTLSGADYLRRYQEHPGQEQPSVLVLDEFVGAGSGDARRAMSHQNVDFGRAWQMLRSKRVVTFATLPDWNEADPRLQKYADYRLWCQEKPIGYFRPYKVTVPFNAVGSGSEVRTKGLSRYEDTDRIAFPNMDAEGDPFYRYLTERKDELIHSSTWDADILGSDEEAEELPDPEEVERHEAVKYAIRLYRPWDDDTKISQADVAQILLHDDYSESWVGNRIREWQNGEHRDLVEPPER